NRATVHFWMSRAPAAHAGAVPPERTLEKAMLNDRNPHWVYTQTIKMFAAPASPSFEDEAELERHWGRVWGIDNDVGQIRSILVHRPGPEMAVVDPAKRIP